MRPRTHFLVDLPMRSGRVTAVTDARDLLALPYVTEVEPAVSVGEVIGSFRKGTAAVRVFGATDDAAEAPALFEQLRADFVLETEPVEAA